jgi:hypothetical protein
MGQLWGVLQAVEKCGMEDKENGKMFNKDRKEIYVFYDRKNIVKLYNEHSIFMNWEQNTNSGLDKAIDRMFTNEDLEYEVNDIILNMEMSIVYCLRDAIEEINDEKVPDTDS